MSRKREVDPNKCMWDWHTSVSDRFLQCQVHEKHKILTYVDKAGEQALLEGLWMRNQLTGTALREVEGEWQWLQKHGRS